MWNSSYADNGRGVSIGIPASLVNKGSGTPVPANFTIYSVSPEVEREEKQPIPLEMLSLFKIQYDQSSVKEIIKCLEAFNEDDFKNDKLIELMVRLFVSIAPLIKNEDYRHESEYRLVYIAPWEDIVLNQYIKEEPEFGIYLETEKILFERFDKFKGNYPNKEYIEVYIGPKVDKIDYLKCADSFRRKYPNVKVELSKRNFR
jgi:hypothetical protein